MLLIAAIFALWQLLTSTGVMDPFFFSKPSDIFARAWEWFRTGYILDDLATTLEETALGFVLGTLLGLVVGFVLARLQWFARVLDPIIKAFNALPRIVLAPIFLLWFGLGMTSKVALGVTVVFFIVFFNVFRGVQEVDQTCLDNVHMLGASEAQKFRHVYLPSALTWIFSSLHISIGFALTAATVSEYLGANRGVGYIIARSELTFDTTGVFAGMLILTVAVVLIDLIVNRAESYLLRWQPTRATDEAGQLT
ncbi:MAG TPA: ABC transporter permease [Segeticoccus sp.]|uniref:ABC transporter permease n=1 Tax=Segeticoccus sp. TaxID=2706531 RepID=UPI002D7FFECD|nr:ABC transporter permease [Segeticoccus sp.]HET8600527.1 ABC transporter permease [Segeticoccus sp.]